jgi:hypothetical protein
MKEKSTDKFNAINKDATVGTKPQIFVFNPPVPTKDEYLKITASVKSAKPKRRKCSGCSRKRKRG